MNERHARRPDGTLDEEKQREYIAMRAKLSPMGIPGEPDDIAFAALYLAAPAARFVTGHRDAAQRRRHHALVTAAPTVLAPLTGPRPPWGAPDADELAARVRRRGVCARGRRARLRAHVDGRRTGRRPLGGRAVRRGAVPHPRPRRAPGAPEPLQRHRRGQLAERVGRRRTADAPPATSCTAATRGSGSSAQEVGIHGFPAGMERYGGHGRPLVVHDPERYGDLHHPGDQASFDIFCQAGRAARSMAIDHRRSAGRAGGAPADRHRWFAVRHASGRVPQRLPP